jgi:hypothetical protein
MLSRRGWWMGALALAAGAALRVWFIHVYPDTQGDPLIYGAIARNWMEHGVYGLGSWPAVRPTLIRLPGYPLFLMACFRVFGVENYRAVMYAQTAIDLGGCVLLAAFVRRIWNARAAWWALWLAALCPFTANYAAAPLTETLEIFVTIVALYALARLLETSDEASRWGWMVLEGAAWSYAALLRPDGALLAVALCPAMVWYGWRGGVGRGGVGQGGVGQGGGVARMMRLAAAAAMLSVLPFVPWAVRNWRTFHVIEPLAPRYATDPGEAVFPGFNRWTKTVCVDLTCTWEIYWNGNGDELDPATLPSRAFDSAEQRTETLALLADYNQTTTISPGIDARFGALAAERMRAHPVRYGVGLPLARVADMWLRPRTELLWIELRWWQFEHHEGETVFAYAYAGLNLLYLLAACWGLRRWPPLALAMVVFVALRCALLATIEAPEPRYTLECFPMVVALAAVGVAGRRDSSLRSE